MTGFTYKWPELTTKSSPCIPANRLAVKSPSVCRLASFSDKTWGHDSQWQDRVWSWSVWCQRVCSPAVGGRDYSSRLDWVVFWCVRQTLRRNPQCDLWWCWNTHTHTHTHSHTYTPCLPAERRSSRRDASQACAVRRCRLNSKQTPHWAASGFI